jgi:hypothetical protein
VYFRKTRKYIGPKLVLLPAIGCTDHIGELSWESYVNCTLAAACLSFFHLVPICLTTAMPGQQQLHFILAES